MDKIKHCYNCSRLEWICTVENNNIYYDYWNCPSIDNKHKNMGADCSNFMNSGTHIHKMLRDKLENRLG